MRNTSARTPSLTHRKLYIAMVAASQFVLASQSYASPEGGQVVGGAGKIDQSGKETIIHQQTNRMAIDWQSFDVKSDERVQFIQPSASSLALNRVISNKGSEILGRIDANGQVMLINPNGVIFGKDSQINAGGILASGLNINPSEFMNGNFTLSEVEGTDGRVVNSGVINAATGGSVTLIGKEVKNDGLIIANLGAVNLAVGKEAVVTFDHRGLVGVKVTKEVLQSDLGVDAALINSGEINAEGGRILITASTSQDIFSQAVNHEGMNAAASVVVNEDGSFTLGGGANVVNTGKISTSSVTGDAGQIAIIGDKITSSGIISADSKTGNAGHIELNSKDTTSLKQTATVSAQATASGKGGDVKILGDKVGLFDSATVNASGANGGGQVLIGGDKTGKNKSINNANFIYLGENTNVKSDALLNGDGGKLITFAQDTARIYGNLYARGGSEKGNGGFIETSGLKGFEILNTPDISAQNGLAGNWLIDPYNVDIVSGNFPTNIGTSSPFDPSGGDASIGVTRILTALGAGATVTVTTGGAGALDDGNSAGNINLKTELTYDRSGGSYTGTLQLFANNNISIEDNINTSSNESLNLIFKANYNVNNIDNIGSGSGGITISSGKTINTNGGYFTATGKNFTLADNTSNTTPINTNGGNVLLTMTGVVDLGDKNTVATNGGNFTANSLGFDSSKAIITTSSSDHTGGGDIKITSTGALNDVKLGALTFGYVVPASNEVTTLSRVGTVEINSDGKVNLVGDINFNNTGARAAATGTRFTGVSATDNPYLKITADGDITINGLISDGFASSNDEWGDYRDALDITLQSNSAIRINKTIYTAGGNFTATGNSFDSSSVKIDTDRANANASDSTSSQNGNATWSNGGDITISASSFISLGNLVTDANATKGNRTGNLILQGVNKSAGVSTDNVNVTLDATKALNVAGTTTFNVGAGDITLGSGTPTFVLSSNFLSGEISFLSAGNIKIKNSGTTLLGASNIGGAFSLTSTDNISQSTGTALNVTGATTFTLSGTNKNITLNNVGNDFVGNVNFSGVIGDLNISDTNNLTLGAISTNSSSNTITVNSGENLTTGAITTSGGFINLTAGNNTTNGGDLSTGALTSTGASNTTAGNILLTAKAGSVSTTTGKITTGILTANGGAASNPHAGLNAGSITLNGVNDISVADIFAKGSDANTTGAGSVGGNVNIESTKGNISVNAITSNGGDAKGASANGGDAGSITLKANNGAGNISVAADLTAQGGSKIGANTNTNGNGGAITLTGNTLLSNSVAITTAGKLGFSGTERRGDILFGGSIKSSTNKNLTLTGKAITFGGDVGDATTNRLGDLAINSIADIGAATRDFYTTSFNANLASNANFSAKNINTSGITGGVVTINGSGNTIVTSVDSSGTGATQNGGDVTISGRAITLGSGNNTAINASAAGSGAAGLINVTATDNAVNGTPSIILKGNIIANGTGNVPAELKLVGSSSPTGTIDFSQYTSATDFMSLINVTGSGGIDTIKAQNIASSWSIGASNTVGQVSFSGVEKIVSGSAANSFVITADGGVTDITAGSSGDTFNLNGGAATTLSMNINGGSGADTFNISANTTGTIDGKAGADNFNILLSGLTAADLIGNSTNATLTGPNILSNWLLLAAGKSTLTTNTNKVINFTGMNKLVGGTAVDNFVLGSSGITKTIDGGTGVASNTLTSFDDLTNDTNWNLTNENSGTVVNAGTNTKTVTFSKIETLNGGAGKDKFANPAFNFDGFINGKGGNDTFTLTHDVLGGISGGDGDDTFDISTSITADIHGNNGSDVFNIKASNLILHIFGDAAGSDIDAVSATNTVNIWEMIGANSGSVKVGAGSTNAASFTGIKSLIGGTAVDTLISSATGTNTWALTSKNNGTLNGLSFSAMENLTGNNQADTFKFLNDFAFDVGQVIDAVGAGNIVDVSGIATAKNVLITLSNTASDPITINGVKNANSVIGNNTNSAITLASTSDTTWTIDSTNGNTVSNAAQSVSFANFSSLTGSTANNTFNLANAFNGTITGAGTNTTINNTTANSIWTLTNSNNGTLLIAGVTTNFNNIKTLGGSETDKLVGRDGVTNTWQITGKNSGSVGSLNFTGMKNILGGNGTDNFNFGLAGFIEGILDGGDGTDTITAANVNNTWTLTGVNSGSLTDGVTPQAYGAAFQNVEKLVGGTANDLFKFSGGSIVDASGGAGSGIDTVSFEDSTVDVEVTLGAAAINGVQGIESFIGSATKNSTLKASNSTGTNTWKIFKFDPSNVSVDGTDDGTVNLADGASISFINFKNLVGGGGTDIFEFFGTDAKLTGSIDGGLGTDKIINNAGASAWVINDSSSTVRAGKFNTTNFLSIEEITGSGSDTLKGGNQNNDWTISGDKSGDIHLTGNTTDKLIFSGINKVIGQSQADNFFITSVDGLSVIVDGGTGADNSLTKSFAGAGTWTITGVQTGKLNNALSFSNIKTIQGNANDTLTGRDQNNDWSITSTNTGNVHVAGSTADQINFIGINKVIGLTGIDIFTLENGATLDSIIGGTGKNTLVNKTGNANWVLDSTTAFKGTLNSKSFEDISVMTGSGTDTLSARNQNNTWKITSQNGGTLESTDVPLSDQITFGGMKNLKGNVLDDTFIFSGTGASIDGTLDGGTGTGINSLAGRSTASTFSLTALNAGNLSNSSTTSIYAIFNNIQKISGGSGSDTLFGISAESLWTFNSNNRLTVTGNSGYLDFSAIKFIQGGSAKDTFTFLTAFAGDVRGGDGDDIFNIGATVQNLFGENGNDTFNLLASGKVNSIEGGNDSNTLKNSTGATANWVLSSANKGSINTNLDAAYVTTFNSIQSLKGSDVAADSLTGINQKNNWVITGANSGTITEATTSSNTISFTDMQNLIGNASDDVFDFSSVNSSVGVGIEGGLGSNSLKAHAGVTNIWSLGSDNISGSVRKDGDANPYVPSFANIQTRVAGSANDLVVVEVLDLNFGTNGFKNFAGNNSAASKLIGFNKNNTWTIDGSNSGSIVNSDGTYTFSGFNNLTGGNQNDNFIFTDNGNIGGIVTGGTNEAANIVNTLTGKNVSAVWQMTAGNSGTVTDVNSQTAIPYAKFVGIQKIIGANGVGKTDLLIGSTNALNTTQLWELGSSKNTLILNGASSGIEFSGMESIQGGSGVNTLSNTINNKSWVLNGEQQGTINSINFSKITDIQGSGTDSLTGRNQDNNWQITGAGVGSVAASNASPTDTIKFSGIGSLIGGTGIDIFNLSAAGSMTNIDGGVTAGDNSNTLIGANIINKWVIDVAGVGTLNDVTKFNHISNLTGGTAQDSFEIANATAIKGIIDGGAGSGTNSIDLTKIANGTNIKVGVGSSAVADIKIANITQLTANANNSNTLIADNLANNSWNIIDVNKGTLNTNLSFIGFANLIGRETQDTFSFVGASAKVTGVIDGGSGADTLNLLQAGANTNVALLNDNLIPVANSINITNIETLNASSNFTNSFAANDKLNTWSITDKDSGTLSNSGLATPISFTNFSILIGGQKDDLFNFSSLGSLTGYIDGGAQDVADIVDLSKLSGKVDIALGDLSKGYRHVEQFVGNNTDSVLYGDDNANTWNLTGQNAGDVNGTVKFSGFTSLVGGGGADVFNILLGQLSGSISGGAGNDTFNITNGVVVGDIKGGAGNNTINVSISDSAPEAIRYIGGDETNTIYVNGGGAGYVVTHGSAIAGGGILRYDANSKAHTVNYSATKVVNDNVTADQLIVKGTDSADVFALSNNSYLLNNFTTINYQNKNNLMIDGSANDKVSIATLVTIPNLLSLNKVSVETTGTGVINANGLLLDGTANVGSSANRLRTNVANLSVNAAAGDIYIQEQNGLNIAAFNTNNNVDLLLDGNLTSDLALQSIGKLSLETTGDILLNKENALSGELNFKAGKNINFRNGGTGTTFGNLSADSLVLSSAGSVVGNGIFNIAGATSLSSDADINLTNAQNDFNSVLITSAKNASLTDKNSLTLTGVTASGDIKVQSQGVVVNGAINSANLSLDAGTGTANIANTINVQNTLQLNAQDIVAAGNIFALKNISATAKGLFSQAGNLSGSDIDLTVGKYTANTGVTTTATSGAVKINSASDISTKDITAATDINLQAANDILGIGVLTATNGKVDLAAGNNLVANADIKAQNGINIIATAGKVDLQSLLSTLKGDASVSASGDITMGATAVTTAAEGNITYTGKNLTVSALNATNGGVTFVASGGVSDANGAATNISAKSFTVDSINGIGMLNADALETTVQNLSLSNQSGDVRIVNSGTVTVDRMRTNGNIFFANLGGDILLDNSKDSVFDTTKTDALAGGTTNANYDLGAISITIDKGNLWMAPGVNSDKTKPVIVANSADIRIGSGSFGQLGHPLVLYVKNSLYYSATRYYKPSYAFGVAPKTVERGAGPQSSLTDILSAGAEQLVVVEDIKEINPAIFTNVRNYVYDDIAIMLPPDQRYEDASISTN